jgi:hypothetical protein
MRLKAYFILIPLLTACLFLTPSFAEGKNDNGKTKLKLGNNNKAMVVKNNKAKVINNKTQVVKSNKVKVINKAQVLKSNNGNVNKYYYSYKGPYKNFKNNNHRNRYFYRGKYYNFKDYYRNYSSESNVYAYKGTYGKNKDIFIFNDRYGNEFDLYYKPVSRTPAWLQRNTLQVGKSYTFPLRTARMYPTATQIKTASYLPFGWGNVMLQNGKYYELHSAPGIVNVGGKLYIN